MVSRFFVACLLAAALVAGVSARSGRMLTADLDCFDDPMNSACASFTISDDVLTANISTLCTSMPEMDGCVLQTECEVRLKCGTNASPEEAACMGSATRDRFPARGEARQIILVK